MKTPMQELLNYTTDLLHTFDSEQRVAMAVLDYLKTNKKALLEKEKETIKKCIVMGMEFIPVDPSRYEEDSELIFNETFNTKER